MPKLPRSTITITLIIQLKTTQFCSRAKETKSTLLFHATITNIYKARKCVVKDDYKSIRNQGRTLVGALV